MIPVVPQPPPGHAGRRGRRRVDHDAANPSSVKRERWSACGRKATRKRSAGSRRLLSRQ